MSSRLTPTSAAATRPSLITLIMRIMRIMGKVTAWPLRGSAASAS